MGRGQRVLERVCECVCERRFSAVVAVTHPLQLGYGGAVAAESTMLSSEPSY